VTKHLPQAKRGKTSGPITQLCLVLVNDIAKAFEVNLEKKTRYITVFRKDNKPGFDHVPAKNLDIPVSNAFVHGQ